MLQSIRPKVCVIGAGPAGFYAAQYLMKHCQDAQVDLLEKLPVPFGLIRYGVAPDHPEVKNVIKKFNQVAQMSNFRFFGNVILGQDVTLKQLREHYHAVLLTYGAESDKKLEIPGEKLDVVCAARDFVYWYNGYPGYEHFKTRLRNKNVCIVGNGNVAIDIARIMLKNVDHLRTTDIPEYALAELSNSRVSNIYMTGRRGPLQAAFTIKELREILNLQNVQVKWRADDFHGLDAVELPRTRKRLVELMLQSLRAQSSVVSREKRFQPIFYRSPIDFSTTSVKLARTVLKSPLEPTSAVLLTNDVEFLESDYFVRSIGYESVKKDDDIPFDERKKKVVNENGVIAPGFYTTGWLATGSSGVLLNTMSNTFATAKLICEHFQRGDLLANDKPGREQLMRIFNEKNVMYVDWQGWEKIDRFEVENGSKLGKPREKVTSVREMVEIAR